MSQTSAVNPKGCHWCGKHHEGVRCPEAKAIEYYPDGTIKRVEFVTPGDWQGTWKLTDWPIGTPTIT